MPPARVNQNANLCIAFGALRSGTTMMRLMLDAHSRLVCPGETDFLFDFLRPLPDGGWRYDLDALAAHRIFQASRARLPSTDRVEIALPGMIEDLRGQSDKFLVLVLHRGIDRALTLMPGLPILHLVRDPRDVARSAIGMGWAGNVYYGSRTWLKTEREWETIAPRLSPGQELQFRYEELVREPEPTLQRVCAHLGQDFEPGMLTYDTQSTYEPPDASLVEQWRVKQTPRQVGLIEPLFGELLVQRGYQPSGFPPVSPSVAERVFLKFEHLFSVWRRRIARYGLRDPLIVSLSNRLGLPKLGRRAMARMDQITRQHLK